jgi:eukaryotic translation initiation factor 2C
VLNFALVHFLLLVSHVGTGIIRSTGETFQPKVTFIVVAKRHHVRFFPTNNNQFAAAKNGNFSSGLVVDRDIVHPTYWDFYLQSQRPLMGTSRPSHYTVLHDENNMSEDE